MSTNVNNKNPAICATYSICILLVSVILSTSGCGRWGDSIIGAWSSYSGYEYGAEHVEFFADKTCFLDSEGIRIVGTWFKVERHRYKLTFSSSFETSTMIIVTVTGDHLAFDLDDIEQSEFVRDGTRQAKRIQRKSEADKKESYEFMIRNSDAYRASMESHRTTTNHEPDLQKGLPERKPYVKLSDL